jgi:proteasome lid subunit RPN8/RPN11
MTDVQELERGILAADQAGDTRTLERLQERYRNTVPATRVSGPDSIRIVERAQTSQASSQRPAGEQGGAIPTVVVVRPEARTTILNDMQFESGMECGGLLVGHTDGNTVVVETVYGARGSNFTGERDRIDFDLEWFRVVDEKAQRCGWAVVGDVHSHRQTDTQPSSTDKRGWRGMAGPSRQHYIGLLLSPDPNVEADRFARPQWQAFIASHGHNSVREIDLCFEPGDIYGT